MEIHRWWDGDSIERCWLEITDRSDLGANLHAAQLAKGGREAWGNSLVREVRPGDTVFHWHKAEDSKPEIVGYSTVAGPLENSTIYWKAHGTASRNEPAGNKPSWLVPLDGLVHLHRPVGLPEIRQSERELRQIRDDLRSRHGDPIYYPWVFSDRRPIRTAQAYLTKLPRAAIELLVGTEWVNQGTNDPPSPTPTNGGPGRQSDTAVRLATEQHAVDRATKYLEDEPYRYNVKNVGAKRSYDLQATKGSEILCVEVKGSTSTLSLVNLTANEVEIARKAKNTLLVVVDQITWQRTSDGEIETSGGRMRTWWGWRAPENLLTPTEYRYELPPEQPDGPPDAEPPKPHDPSGNHPLPDGRY
jgi:hypothetical protein